MRHEHEGEALRASCHVYLHKTRGFLCYVFYITATPYLPCNNYKPEGTVYMTFIYYTAITLTTGYKYRE